MFSLLKLVEAATTQGASVLRITSDRVPVLEAAGDLIAIGDDAFAALALERTLVEALDAEGRARLASAHEVEAWLAIDGGLRLSARIVRGASGLMARVRVAQTIAPRFETLGCPESVRRLFDRKSGLVIVSGRRGAGKTTLAAGMLDSINQTRVSRLGTIERPIEIALTEAKAQIIQREVGADTPSFTSALRDATGEGLDAIVVAELPDREAVLAALDLANAGVLVIAIVPSRGAVAAIRELCATLEEGSGADLLAETLAGVVGVCLVPRADGRGPVAAHEVLLGSAALAAMIREDRVEDAAGLMAEGGAAGMQTFDAALERLVAGGIVRLEHATARAHDRIALERAIARRGGA